MLLTNTSMDGWIWDFVDRAQRTITLLQSLQLLPTDPKDCPMQATIPKFDA